MSDSNIEEKNRIRKVKKVIQTQNNYNFEKQKLQIKVNTEE